MSITDFKRKGSTQSLYNVKYITDGYFIRTDDVPVFAYEIKEGVNVFNRELPLINDLIQQYTRVFETLEDNDMLQIIASARPLDASIVMNAYTNNCILNDRVSNDLIIYSQDRWIRNISNSNWARNISFYMLISVKKPKTNQAFDALLGAVQQKSMSIQGYMNRCQLEMVPLNKFEIKNLFDRECSPNMQELPDKIMANSAPVDNEVAGFSSQRDALARDAIIPHKDCLEFGSGIWSRTFYCEALPFNNWMEDGKEARYKANLFFQNVLIHCGYMRFSLYAYGQNQADAKKTFQKQFKQFEQVMHAASAGDEDTQVAISRSKITLERAAQGLLHYNKFSLYITLHANNKADLDEKANTLESILGEFHLKRGYFEQDIHYTSSLPFCSEKKNKSEDIPADGLANAFPFVSTRVGMKSGILLGFDQLGEPVYFNPWSRDEVENAITVKIGQPGSGKSFSEEIEGLLLYPENIVSCVFHKSTSYDFSNKLMGGQSLKFGVDSETKINIFDPSDAEELKTGPSVDTVMTILGALEIMLYTGDKMEQLDTSLLENAIRMTFENSGGKVPRLEDLCKSLEEMAKDQEMQDHRVQLRSLKTKLGPFVGKGIYANMTNCESSVDIHSNRVVVDLSGIPENDKMLFNLAMFMCTKIAYKVKNIAQKQGISKALIKFDETWAFISSEYGRKLLSNLSRRSRHMNVAVYLSTQYASDCNVNEEAKAFLRGAQSIFILKQPATDRNILKEIFNLNERELDMIGEIHQVKGVYSQCYAITGNRRGLIHIMSNPHLYWVATSEPIRDIPRRNEVIKKYSNNGNVDYVAAIRELAET